MNVTAQIPTRFEPSVPDCWATEAQLRLLADRVGTPAFLYSETRLVENVERMRDAAQQADLAERVAFFVPFFPNSNPHVIRAFKELDIGVLIQLPSEYELLTRHGFRKFIVSTGHIADDEIDFWAGTGLPMFLSSMDEVVYLLDTAPGATVNVRFDSLSSGKPGLKYNELHALSALLKARGRRLDCFELYCGSGNSVHTMISIIEQVFMIFRTYFPEAKAINFAGGFSFAYEDPRTSGKHFDWQHYFGRLRELAGRYGIPQDVAFWFEPARDLLGDVGVLLLSVQRPVIRHPGANRVLTNGSRVLMPSAQYKERKHNVLFLDDRMRLVDGPAVPALLRGRGILRHDYVLPKEYMVPERLTQGDHVLILDVGAYCATQHMEFLNIPPAAEAIVGLDGVMRLATRHGGSHDKWRHLLEACEPV
jgi:diaminopimelate decarboxylase